MAMPHTPDFKMLRVASFWLLPRAWDPEDFMHGSYLVKEWVTHPKYSSVLIRGNIVWRKQMKAAGIQTVWLTGLNGFQEVLIQP